MSSGTAALHTVFANIGLEPGDEVISTPMTFVATQATAAIAGAKNIFVDIDMETGLIDIDKISKRITKHTKAIVSVDYAGQPADMEKLKGICQEAEILLIEDAAHSIGTTQNGKKVGSIADVTTFSFFPTKNITTGEGGAISSAHSELLESMRTFSRQGLIYSQERFLIDEKAAWHREVHKFGLNYRLSDISCALGRSQLIRLKSMKARRKEIFGRYVAQLSSLEDVRFLRVNENNDVMWHLFPIFVSKHNRKHLFYFLRDKGVGVQVNYMPAYKHPAFRFKGKLENAESFYESQISLPMSSRLTDFELNYITECIHEFYRNAV